MLRQRCIFYMVSIFVQVVFFGSIFVYVDLYTIFCPIKHLHVSTWSFSFATTPLFFDDTKNRPRRRKCRSFHRFPSDEISHGRVLHRRRRSHEIALRNRRRSRRFTIKEERHERRAGDEASVWHFAEHEDGSLGERVVG